MDSEEFSAFIGHNYAGPAPILQHQMRFDNDPGNSTGFMGELLPLAAQARMRDQTNFILNEGSIRNTTGPDMDSSNGSQQSPPEVNSQKQVPTNVKLHSDPNAMNYEQGDMSKIKETQQGLTTWSNIVAKNVDNTEPQSGDASISYNEDGSATVRFSNEFF